METVAILKTDAGYFLMANKESKCIQGFKNIRAGLTHFEDSYTNAIARGGTWSAAACIHMIEFQPAIVQFTNIEEIKKLLPKKWSAFSLNGAAGFYTGIKLKKREGAAAWNMGKEPKLMEL